jgi:hypothetical protein
MKNQAKVCISIHWLGVYVHVPYNQTLQLINGCKSYHKPSAIWTTDHRNYLWISQVRFFEKYNELQYQSSSISSLAQITLFVPILMVIRQGMIIPGARNWRICSF